MKTVKDMQSNCKSKGKQPIQGADVVRRIVRQLEAPGSTPKPTTPTVYRFENGGEAVRAKGVARGFLKLEVATGASDEAELLKLIAQAIRDTEEV